VSFRPSNPGSSSTSPKRSDRAGSSVHAALLIADVPAAADTLPLGASPSGRWQELSDSGSGMGAAGRCQARPEAVTVPSSTSLTCGNVVQQRLCWVAFSVRIEGARVQIPSAPPSSCSSATYCLLCSLRSPIRVRFWERLMLASNLVSRRSFGSSVSASMESSFPSAG